MNCRNWTIVALALGAAIGCKKSPEAPGAAGSHANHTAAKPAGTEGAGGAAHATQGEHAHRSPHGGLVATVATGHLELLASPDGALIVYVLDADLKPLRARAVELITRVGASAVDMKLAKEEEGRYEGRAAPIDGEHPVSVVSGTIDGQAVSARFELHLEKADAAHAGHAAPGSAHVHPGAGDAKSDATMDFSATPAVVKAGSPVTMTFTPKGPDGKVLDLDIVHEKPLHLLMVSSGLSWFAHEHPALGPDGSLTFSFTFPAGGEFWVYTDFTPKGGGNVVQRHLLQVDGEKLQEPPLAATPMTVTSGSYSLMYHGPKVLRAGQTAKLAFHILKDGKDVTDLTPYLGAMGHLVGIAAEGGAFVHAHPEGHGGPGSHHAMAGEHAGHGSSNGPMVTFDAVFPNPGTYRVWPQFQHLGQIVMGPMVMNVVP